MDDGIRVKRARHHVAGCDPAADAGILEGCDEGVGDCLVLRGVADKDFGFGNGGRAGCRL